jgi:dihydrofolate reductase
MSIAFKGYAIVSADGFIADEAGEMPDSLRFDADWRYFQAALDAADLTLLGRHTHEAAPNKKERRRLVVSRGVRAMLQENACTWWVNSDDVAPTSAATVVAGSKATVAVVGGTGVFSWILDDVGFQEFHLSIAHDVRLGSGRPLLDDAVSLEDAIGKLEAKTLSLGERRWLDQGAGLELLIFSGRHPDGEDEEVG